MLDGQEQARAARFKFPRHRVQYVVAHALTRLALGRHLSADPASIRFVEGANGKPVAELDRRPAAVSFNLSHTEGMVGVAVLAVPGVPVGFDVEALDRTVDIEVADRFFRPEEVAWLAGLAGAEQARGFLRLWTLKEALIKATGEALSRDLASFWFEVFPPRLHFTAPDGVPEDGWRFEQRIVDASFVAAVGLRSDDGMDGHPVWHAADPALLLGGLRLDPVDA
jgi:4'-phosphopantetheinyl transferase